MEPLGKKGEIAVGNKLLRQEIQNDLGKTSVLAQARQGFSVRLFVYLSKSVFAVCVRKPAFYVAGVAITWKRMLIWCHKEITNFK